MSEFELYQGDCLEVMQDIPDASVDLILCDLPYGTTQNKWDAVIPFEPLWEQYHRVCKGAVVLTAAQPFTSALVMSNVNEFKYDWVWDKVNRYTGFLNAKKMPLRRHESVLIFGKSAAYNEQVIMKMRMGGGPRGTTGACYGDAVSLPTRKASKEPVEHHPFSIIGFEAIGGHEPKGLHPTQKPVALMEYLIRTYTNEGMTVLDNCMGSGTTGVACMNTNRNFIGIEMDSKYIQIAHKRITEAANLNLSAIKESA